MSYKYYVTYICCVILNNIQILFQASRTYIHIHESFFFGHLLLRIHYSMAPPGLDPEEGSQRFISFLIPFSSSDLGLSRSNPRTACFLFKMYGCVNVCVCTYNPTSIRSLFLFSFCFQLWLWFHLLTLGDLCWTSPKVLVWPQAIESRIWNRRTPNISVFNSDSYSILKYV